MSETADPESQSLKLFDGYAVIGKDSPLSFRATWSEGVKVGERGIKTLLRNLEAESTSTRFGNSEALSVPAAWDCTALFPERAAVSTRYEDVLVR